MVCQSGTRNTLSQSVFLRMNTYVLRRQNKYTLLNNCWEAKWRKTWLAFNFKKLCGFKLSSSEDCLIKVGGKELIKTTTYTSTHTSWQFQRNVKNSLISMKVNTSVKSLILQMSCNHKLVALFLHASTFLSLIFGSLCTLWTLKIMQTEN